MRLFLVAVIGMFAIPLPSPTRCPPQDAERYSRLIQTLRGSDLDEKTEAMRAIILLGPSDKAGTPVFAAALKDPQTNVRAWAARALEAIGPAAADAVPALVLALRDSQRTVRRNAAFALAKVDEAAAIQTAVPALIEAFGEPNPYQGSGQPWDVPCQAATALSGLGSVPEPILARLDQGLESGGPSYRMCVAEALVRLGQAGRGMPVLIRALTDEAEYVRKEAVDAMGRLGPLAKEAAPALTALSEKDSEYIRVAATEALRRILKQK
jgi:HEAT repeat protein